MIASYSDKLAHIIHLNIAVHTARPHTTTNSDLFTCNFTSNGTFWKPTLLYIALQLVTVDPNQISDEYIMQNSSSNLTRNTATKFGAYSEKSRLQVACHIVFEVER